MDLGIPLVFRAGSQAHVQIYNSRNGDGGPPIFHKFITVEAGGLDAGSTVVGLRLFAFDDTNDSHTRGYGGG